MNSKQEIDLKDYAQHANNVLAWLQTINKTKSSPRQPLEEQLQSLSLSYKNAQEKLLSLEKQVYYESLHNQKQRSIIQILKYIINGNLDDDTILTYLVDMQDQSVPDLDTKYQIRSELQQIKDIVLKRKTNAKKNQSLKAGAIADLKKQLNKCNQVKKELMQDLDRTLNQKGQMQSSLEELKIQIASQIREKQQLKNKIEILKSQQSKTLQAKVLLEQQLVKISKDGDEKQHVIRAIKQSISKITKCQQSSIAGTQNLLIEFKKVQNKLEKYRAIGKQLSEKLKKQALQTEYISSLKNFLPSEALKISQQFQKQGQQCFLKELQDLAKLQKKKYSQLQNCQQEVWRLKSKLLREGDSWLKSKRTGISNSRDKENIQPNEKDSQSIQEFKFDI